MLVPLQVGSYYAPNIHHPVSAVFFEYLYGKNKLVTALVSGKVACPVQPMLVERSGIYGLFGFGIAQVEPVL